MKSFVNVELIKTALSRLISAFNNLEGVPYLTKPQIISAINTKYGTEYPANHNVIISVVRSTEKYIEFALADFNSETAGERKFGAELLIYQLPWFENLFTKDHFEWAELEAKYSTTQNPWTIAPEIEYRLLPHSVIEKRTTWFTEERYYVLTDVRRKIRDKRKKYNITFSEVTKNE